MMSGEKLCLQWNDFAENITSTFTELREDREFADVTLACEDGQQIEAHKVVLISSSPFFRSLLSKNRHPSPLIYMRGVDFGHLSALADFLYLGEANVAQEELESFLGIATELKLKGFSGVEKDVFQPAPKKSKKKPGEKKILASAELVKSMEDIDKKPQMEMDDQSLEKTTALVSANYDRVDADMDRLDEQISSMIAATDRSDPKSGKLFACKVSSLILFNI